MENVMFSDVKRAHGLARFLWPIHSFAQIKAIVLFNAVGLPLLALVLYLYGQRDAILSSLIGVTLAGAPALFMNLPATLELTTRGEARNYIRELCDLLRSLGYTEGELRGSDLHFAGHLAPWMRRLPRYIWWKKEVGIDLSVQDHTIMMRGPKSNLDRVKHRGERDLSDARHA